MSTRMLADAAGTLTDRYDYDAFGNVLGSQGTTPNEYRFDGQRLDPSLRLYHLRARYYDPIAGRFTTTDPFPGVIFEPASLHPYTYAYNDPVNKSDPSGKFTLAEQMTIAAAVGVYAGLGYAAENYYYYRSGELAFEAGVDAFFSVGSLTLDMLGVGAFVRTGMAAIARGIGEAFASRTLINQTARNIGKTAKDLVDESLERVLCRFNNPKLCTINAITQVGSVRRMAGPYVTFLRGKAIQAARAELAGVPVDVTAKQAAEVATEALETLVQKTTTLDDAAKILEGLLKWP
jgi:RHS repeat-associated protein